MRVRYALFTLGLTLLAGCGGQVLIVHRAPTPAVPSSTEELKGVPFYVRTAGCKQQTVWLQPIYSLILREAFTPATQKPEDKTPPQVKTFVVVLTVDQYRRPEVLALRNLLNSREPGPTPPEVSAAWSDVQNRAGPDPYSVNEDQLSGTDASKVMRVANVVTTEKYVDYSTTYFYNTNRPLAGTAQASIKLGDEGTMTEASGQIESKTLQAFLDLLPVKDVLSTVAKAYLPAPDNKAHLAAYPPGTYKFKLSVDAKIFKHSHDTMLKDPKGVYLKPPCPAAPGDVTAPYNFTVEDVTDKKPAGEDGPTVKVNGSVVLPKPDQKKN